MSADLPARGEGAVQREGALANMSRHDLSASGGRRTLAHDAPEGECQVVWYKEDTEVEDDEKGHDDVRPAALALRTTRGVSMVKVQTRTWSLSFLGRISRRTVGPLRLA